MTDKEKQMDTIDLITDEGKIILITCEFEYVDEAISSIMTYLSSGKTWSPALIPGHTRVEYMEMHELRWINMRRIIGVRSS